jgi:hypothetical protein
VVQAGDEAVLRTDDDASHDFLPVRSIVHRLVGLRWRTVVLSATARSPSSGSRRR